MRHLLVAAILLALCLGRSQAQNAARRLTRRIPAPAAVQKPALPILNGRIIGISSNSIIVQLVVTKMVPNPNWMPPRKRVNYDQWSGGLSAREIDTRPMIPQESDGAKVVLKHFDGAKQKDLRIAFTAWRMGSETIDGEEYPVLDCLLPKSNR